MENKDIVRIGILPEFGDAYEVELPVPNDVDIEDYVEQWIDANTINIQEWEFDE